MKQDENDEMEMLLRQTAARATLYRRGAKLRRLNRLRHKAGLSPLPLAQDMPARRFISLFDKIIERCKERRRLKRRNTR
jgi:hypothetical protein